MRSPESVFFPALTQTKTIFRLEITVEKIDYHHYEVSAQKYAIDIVKINKLGLRCNTLNASLSEKYNIFGDVIYSPCSGTIVELVDNCPDMKPGQMDPEHLAGNHLIIEMDEPDASILLGHIMKNSFLIQKGDIIKRGQPIAKVGNSGNTSEPHLHMHVVRNKSGDLVVTGDGIPMKFNHHIPKRNDRIHSNL